ncbi:MAG: hypothetical protein DRP78_01135 [Candidatus Omnitrophota bacterium]|nr:MAG: hypothetical protein DRP78_01135 [Candidatus Omnitrophota bacterium]
MKKICYFLVVLMVFFAGIANGYAEVIGNADTEVKNIAAPLLDSVILGLEKNSYSAYTQNFAQNKISKQRFSEINKKIASWLGSYLNSEYLGFLNKGGNTLVFWKGTFEKTQDEILIKMKITKINDKNLIIGLEFE